MRCSAACGGKRDLVAAEPGPVVTDNGMLTVIAAEPLGAMHAPDIVLVPGGPGEVAAASAARSCSGWPPWRRPPPG